MVDLVRNDMQHHHMEKKKIFVSYLPYIPHISTLGNEIC
jgi:hypothetical protein